MTFKEYFTNFLKMDNENAMSNWGWFVEMEPSNFEKNIKSYRYKSSQYVSIPETIYEEPVNAFKSTKSYKDMSMMFDMEMDEDEELDDIDKFNKYHQIQIDRIIVGINVLGVIMVLLWIM